MFINFDLAIQHVQESFFTVVQEDAIKVSADLPTANAGEEETPAPGPDTPVTTMALGEEGGGKDTPIQKPGDTPITTLAIGEEGGNILLPVDK